MKPILYWSKRKGSYVWIPYDEMVFLGDGKRGLYANRLTTAAGAKYFVSTHPIYEEHKELFFNCRDCYVFKGDLSWSEKLIYAYIYNIPTWAKLCIPVLMGIAAGWCLSQLIDWVF